MRIGETDQDHEADAAEGIIVQDSMSDVGIAQRCGVTIAKRRSNTCISVTESWARQ